MPDPLAPLAPPSPERAAYLARLRSTLDLPPPMADDVIEEISGHLDDTMAALVETGVDPADAERRALARLGDPASLGKDLGDARRRRRRLLAMVGGGLWGLFADGFKTSLMLGLAMFLASMVALPTSIALLRALDRGGWSFLTGPSGSVLTMAISLFGAWLVGRLLPARIAVIAERTAAGVRRQVALVALVAGSLAIWVVPSFQLDVVSAIGTALMPVALAVGAATAPDRPGFRPGFVPAAVASAAFVPIIVAGALLSAYASPQQESWSANLDRFGVQPSEIGEPADAQGPYLQVMPYGPTSSWDGGSAASVTLGGAAGLVHDVRIEVWETRLENEELQWGDAPLVTSPVILPENATPEDYGTADWVVPMFREPVRITTLLIGIAQDGRRVVLAEDLSLSETPAWRGTLAEWFFGG